MKTKVNSAVSKMLASPGIYEVTDPVHDPGTPGVKAIITVFVNETGKAFRLRPGNQKGPEITQFDKSAVVMEPGSAHKKPVRL